MSAGALVGRRVAVTQAAHQAPALARLLAARGAEPLLYPCIAIAPPADPAPLDAALRDAAAGRFAWLVLTSANTVAVLRRRLDELALAPAQLAGTALAAVGQATARAIHTELGRAADLVAGEQQAEGLLAGLIPLLRPGMRVLVPQADIARPLLAQELAAAGVDVTAVAAYRTVVGSGGVALPALLAARKVDAITFTSSSTVHNLVARLADEGGDPAHLAGVCVACIGQVTAETAAAVGLPASLVAREPSIEGLVAALEQFWSEPK